MLNIHELERQWLRYKIKSYIPLVLSLLASLSIVSLLFIYVPTSDDEAITPLKIETSEPLVVQSQPVIKQKDIQVPVVPPVELHVVDNTQEQIKIGSKEEKNTLVLKPSLQFMDNIEEGLSVYLEEEAPMQEPTAVSSLQENDALSVLPANEVTKDTITDENADENRLNITSNKSDSDLDDVVRRFKKNKNPALSLFIAKRYYAIGEYQKSYNYALMTNEIDKNIEESWIIFSKSLVKLGQHELAMNTLKSYLKTTKSTSAEVLLRKIESGTFK